MSYAIHVYVAEEFSERAYQDFLNGAKCLFGKWDLAQSTPMHAAGRQIHQCLIESKNTSRDEGVRVWVDTTRRSPDEPARGFEYKWRFSFETSTGRTALGLAVQLGSAILATQKFRFVLLMDHDCDIENGVTEFRTPQAVMEHTRKVLKFEFAELASDLHHRGIVNDGGFLMMPAQEI